MLTFAHWRKVLLPAALLAVTAVPAQAAEDVLTLPANRETQIGFIAPIAATTCEVAGKPKIHIAKAPAHGKVRTQWTTAKYRNLSSNPAYNLCNGKTVHGTAIFYRPDNGFRGTDTFSLGVTTQRYVDGPGNQTFLIPATIHVK